MSSEHAVAWASLIWFVVGVMCGAVVVGLLCGARDDTPHRRAHEVGPCPECDGDGLTEAGLVCGACEGSGTRLPPALRDQAG